MSMTPLNPWLAAVASPPIPEAKSWLAAYDGRAGEPLDLSQAVPADPPPPALRERLAKAAGDSAAAAYGPIAGDMILREAYADHVNGLYASQLTPDDVVITAGCNLAFVMAAMTLAKAGDNLILPTPCYFNHAMALGMLGIEARVLACPPAQGFVPDAGEAEKLIDRSTRAIILVTPNNPTGAVYPPAIIEAFADLCERRGLTLVIDETYRDFLADEALPPHRLLARAAGKRTHVVQLYSFSKAYGIPGHRLGAMVVPEHWRSDLGKVLDTLQICPPRPGQIACAWAIDALTSHRLRNRDDILRRAIAFHDAFAPLKEWKIGSIGAYFAYVRHGFPHLSSEEVARRMALQQGVLALPGTYFEPRDHGYLRFAFANADAARIATLPARLSALTAMV